jgi:hypothetical protein
MTNRAKSLVKETSTTTGTGTYTLDGAVSGFRTFNAACGNGANVYTPYVVRMGSDYEIGIGRIATSTTLVRVKVLESSNADAAVSWAAGSKTIYAGLGGGLMPTGGKDNYGAFTSPGAGDSYVNGYSFGSKWWDSAAEILWLCADDGSASSGGATWVAAYHRAIKPLYTHLGALVTASASFGEGDIEAASTAAVGVFGGGIGAVALWPHSRIHGLGYSNSSGPGAHSHSDGIGFTKETTNATPVVMDYMGAWASVVMGMAPSCAILVDATVVARCHADNDCRAWKVSALIQRNGTGDPALVGSVTYTAVGGTGTAGASAWDVTLSVNTTNDGPQFTVTGAAAKTIRWSAHAAITQVANY